MRLLRRHPTFRELSEYQDLGDEHPDCQRIRTHLQDCTRCRDEVAWLRRLSEEARKLGAVKPPDGIIERVLERRAAGERVILPTNGPVNSERSTPSSSTLILVLAAGALIGLAAAILLASEATAGSNHLTFEPRQPRPGQALEVTYRPALGLAGADSLRLRARFRGVGQERGDEDLPGGRIETVLRRNEDGLYVGSVTIPSVAAYGQMSVEDTRATHVDSNNGRLWEILTYDDEGVRYEALRQRLIAAQGLDWRRLLETTEQTIEAFPERPEGWYRRLAAERRFVDASALDSLLGFHREALERLEVALSDQDVSPSDLADLAQYAAALGRAAAAEFWGGRLERLAPRHPRLLRLRAFNALAAGGETHAVLATIDSLWARSDRGDADVARLAFDLAFDFGDLERARSWAGRLNEVRPGSEAYIGRRLATNTATRPDAIRYLREACDRVRGLRDGARPLRLNGDTWERDRDGELRVLLAELGRTLAAESFIAAADDALREALGLEAYAAGSGDLAGLALSLGDSLAAVDLLAEAAADPLAAHDVALRGRQLARESGVSRQAWTEMLAAHRGRLERMTLERAEYHVLPPDVAVATSAGASEPVRNLSGGRPMLLAVRAAFSPAFNRRSLIELDEIHVRARGLGHRMVVLLLPRGGYDPDPFLAGEFPFTVVHDAGGGVAEALGVWSTAAYVVLDAEGLFRGVFADAADALRLMSFLPRASLTA